MTTPGVIRKELGKVSFSQDTLTVKMDMRPVKQFRDTLRKAKLELERLLAQKEFSESTSVRNATRSLLKSQLGRLDLMFHSREKRALFSFGGDILHSIFGTATDKQVDKVNSKIRAIEKWAVSKGNLMDAMLDRLNKHSEDIKTLNNNLNELADLLN